MKRVNFLIILILFNSLSHNSFSQTRLTKEKGVYYYFDKYDFLLPKDSIKTTLLYLGLIKLDVEKLNGHYKGVYKFASFVVNKKTKIINVKLFDKDKNFSRDEVYTFTNKITQKSDTVFYNLSGMTEVKSWSVIPTTSKAD
jgi:hypothetical protein